MRSQIGIARPVLVWGLLAAAGCAMAGACSSNDHNFGSNPAATGGDDAAGAGVATSGGSNSGGGTAPAGGAGTPSSAVSGAPPSSTESGGGTNQGGSPPIDGMGGAGGIESSSACGSAYVDWFRATFPYPEGGILGTADFPSSPWRTLSGTLTTKAGAAVSAGNGIAIASEGTPFDYDASRARFKLTFSKTEQTAALRLNATKAGAGGVAVRVAGDTGEVTVTEDDQPLATKSFGAIQLNAPAFVQVTFAERSALITLSTTNYADVPGSTMLGTLRVSELQAAPAGTYAAIELSGAGASIDDIGFARCGSSPPKYKALFRDTFNRANSTDPGKPELPASSAWTGDTDYIGIGANRLNFSGLKGGALRTEQGQHYQSSGLRIRSSAKFDTEGWFIVRFNQNATGSEGSGFDIYRETDSNVFIEYGGAPGSSRFPLTFDLDTFYFMQFDLQDEAAIVTVRSGSYDGPVLFGSAVENFNSQPVDQTILYLGNTWSSNLAIDEIYVDQYAP